MRANWINEKCGNCDAFVAVDPQQTGGAKDIALCRRSPPALVSVLTPSVSQVAVSMGNQPALQQQMVTGYPTVPKEGAACSMFAREDKPNQQEVAKES